MSKAGFFHALAWCMGELGPKARYYTLLDRARMLPVSTNHSQDPNFGLRKKYTKSLASALH